MRTSVLLSLFLSLAPLLAAAEDVSPAVVEMHGFKVDFHLATAKQKEKVIPTLERQMEIVESAGLSKEILTFFRSVPVVVDPDLTAMFGEYRQQEGQWIVRIKPASIPTDRPIMLHELLHAYHHQKLGQTPAIRAAYESALRSNMYPDKFRKAHFLENPKEYFAVIGSIYLFGQRIDQPPFDCSIPRRTQPEFIAFLGQQFGTRECH